MGDLSETDTLGRRLPGCGSKAGPESVTQTEGVIEPKPIAASVKPVARGGDQMVAHLGLLGIKLRLTDNVEKACIVPRPVPKAEPGTGGGFRIPHRGDERWVAIRDMIGNEVQYHPHSASVCGLNEYRPGGFASKRRLDREEVTRRITVIIGRGENRCQPQGVDPQFAEPIQMRSNST